MGDGRTTERERYLARVAGALRMPDDAARDVVEELAAHVADATASLRAEGLDAERAEREALARLGNPEVLGEEMRRAHQSRRRLLAAAGAGVVAAGKGFVVGALVSGLIGYGVLLGSLLLLALVTQLVFGNGWVPQTADAGWNSALGGLFLMGAAFASARAGVQATSRRSGRRIEQIRLGWALAGGLIVALYVLFFHRTQLNAAAVVAHALVPIAFASGAWNAGSWAGFQLRGWRFAFAVTLPFLVSALLLAGTRAGGGTGGDGAEIMGSAPPDFTRIAPGLPEAWWPADISTFESYSNAGAGVVRFRVGPTSAFPSSRFGDLRVEAWATREADHHVDVAPDATGPFAVAAASIEDDAFVADVRVDRAPGVVTYALALTGTGPEGLRYLLAGPSIGTTAFNGTAWEWFTLP